MTLDRTAPRRSGSPSAARHGRAATRAITEWVSGACVAAALASAGGVALAQEAPPETLAAQARQQGYRCDAPVTAQRDPELTRPDEAAWILSCGNATYQMRLVPDMAARIERRAEDPGRR